ncbi:MAG: hypothetical protein IIC92_08310 [Chloroflexi bacterium]|nr:hypothetical protein [Chloroflexota bacterium]
MVEAGSAKRAGLLATQGIRGGANRDTLRRIKESGDIFFAESDRPWVLEGATVHVSMVGFDDGSESRRVLDEQGVEEINANLTTGPDLSRARRLRENLGMAFMGDTKGGPFDITGDDARYMLSQPNPHGKNNRDVIRPWINGRDITDRSRGMYLIDFGVDMPEEEAALYEAPFEYVKKHVQPTRAGNRLQVEIDRWWIHLRPRRELRSAIEALPRFIVTPGVSKHRVFKWDVNPTLPDHALFVFARDDDYFFGVLHSRPHELWALATGTQLESRPRYTPTTTFETFPFPQPTDAQRNAIAEAARILNEERENWLNPPPDPDTGDIMTGVDLKKRTLTNLYNTRPSWLQFAHERLDAAVLDAYGWPTDITDEQILERLLDLNFEREPA